MPRLPCRLVSLALLHLLVHVIQLVFDDVHEDLVIDEVAGHAGHFALGVRLNTLFCLDQQQEKVSRCALLG